MEPINGSKSPETALYSPHSCITATGPDADEMIASYPATVKTSPTGC
jgi:hypothetical protein